ncbi:diphosphate--fructose-6-phosphate 1-phosphotransferase [Waddlia chondrophila]|uniref:Pyrophosphate--fructose 6-phosphate 1-phosphotransferase n=1 Tax=Waddlia chondrophila (strain ATCC VR-1470 / WSU 86-1044) TaxID=716544 RepID=D6YWC7_WADCW|nr:diphosphate--fructose-6-phosphate 1-phosphotransferase [Waddlia chondrophila]ADI38438.1 phosphofructokinase [Waddlia chondrophila WSU 86-1044]
MKEHTALEEKRLEYIPKLPAILHDLRKLKTVNLKNSPGKASEISDFFPLTIGQTALTFTIDQDHEKTPLKVGVVLSGGQAAGGHNVITGLFDALKELHSKSQLFGFLNGPSGIVNNQTIELTEEILHSYRNQGGFDLIGAGRTKIETNEQFQGTLHTVKALDLDGIVIIGGDDSNTNAALLAEFFMKEGVRTRVIGVPKTIDGDLKNAYIDLSFGFDTAVKTYSGIIGNIARDSLSAKKYYFFIKLMGRSASHIALECALQTHANYTLIGEEINEEKATFQQITNRLSDVICRRAELSKHYGVILIPEGLIEFIPEFRTLIAELNEIKIDSELSKDERIQLAMRSISSESLECYKSLPRLIQEQLMLDRDPHGNVQVSKIETERLFIEAVKQELKRRKEKGEYTGSFNAQPHFCGYEGRSCLPSNFDSQYCYALGHVAALLIDANATGYMSCVKNLSRPIEEWQICGIPLTSMIHKEMRKGKLKPVIAKALVDLQGAPFQYFKEKRLQWEDEDDYRYPGPVQFFGPSEITDAVTLTLELSQNTEAILN